MYTLTNQEKIFIASAIAVAGFSYCKEWSLPVTLIVSVGCGVLTTVATTCLQGYKPKLFGDAKNPAIHYEGLPGQNNGFSIKDPNPPRGPLFG